VLRHRGISRRVTEGRPGLEQRPVNVDFPAWMIESLDREARRLGVNRQSIIHAGSWLRLTQAIRWPRSTRASQ
jgi:hypothetical protein